ncbi:MAG: hypothetical protein IKQ01_00305 [Bacteroidales bacterium]|nr:hypothetical protein [Bacteroidales bacterium]
MFNSIGNNFGAGQITFKDYQAENYVVLNSKFSFDPTNADYQACDQLEIYVPDLTIDRSAVGGVFIRFVEDYHYSWGDSVYDGGTVLKSWIKDKNTIVIEKQPWFDQNGPLIIYIVTLYPQLNQGSNTIKGAKERLTMTTEGNYLYFSSDTFIVAFENWVFIHLQFSSCSYAYRDSLWEVTMEQLPADITVDVPICGGGNQMHPNCDGMAEAHIENKVLTSQRRVMGFFDTGHDPFVYAFLVRDNNA